jgi:hypothetical protein
MVITIGHPPTLSGDDVRRRGIRWARLQILSWSS